MIEIESTSDPVRLSFVQAVLSAADVPYYVFEPHVGGLWPGAVATRVMVSDRDAAAARAALAASNPKELWR